MRYRAIAVATERSNAVGEVELACTLGGLEVTYLGVGSFADGYAPGALTTGTRIVVPWPAVLDTRIEGDQLFLALDPATTPHHRMSLASFSTGGRVDPNELRRRRLILRLATGSAALTALVTLVLSVPRIAPRAGAALALLLGALAAGALLAVGLVTDRWLVAESGANDAAREAFAAEIGLHRGTVSRSPARAGAPRPVLAAAASVLPRSTTAVVITLTATVLGAVLTGQWVLRGGHDDRARPAPTVAANEPEPLVARAESPAPLPRPLVEEPQAGGSTAQPAVSATPDTRDPAPTVRAGAPCSCARADSLLWPEPPPKLDLLVIGRRVSQRGTRRQLEIDLAAVNNGDTELRELNVGLQFVERDPPPSEKEYPTDYRAVYFQGPLGPGQAIKWTVDARGTDVKLTSPVEGTLSPTGEGAAPQNLVASLLDANHRPVRLHGAMLLAFLGDARAREAALKLRDALREDEAPYLDRLLRALADTRACDVRLEGTDRARTIAACVHNASNEARDQLGMRVRGLASPPRRDEPTSVPPELVSEHTFAVPGSLGPGQGVTVTASFEIAEGTAPRAFEAFVDRADLLP